MKKTLEYLFAGNTLTRNEARETLIQVGEGKYSEAEFASFLTIFKMRPLQAEELAGFRDAMLELSTKVDLDTPETIDIVGTGGDGKNTFNISTLASIVVAGAGIKVTKHGNYAASSTSGSSNVLEFLGYRFSNDPHKLKDDLERGNFCFLHAPLFHPAMKHIAPVRKALKFPTFFNILGPMINPATPKYQLLGVNNMQTFEHYKAVYQTLDTHFAIVHSLDGYDEISLTDQTRIAFRNEEKSLSPDDFGVQAITPEKLFGGGTVADAAGIFLSVLKGEGSREQNDAVLANAAVAINLVYPQKQLNECLEMAKESLFGGTALAKLKAITQD